MKKNGPNPNDIYPNPNINSICYIKNTNTNPNIIIGDYTYYSDLNDCKNFEKHVSHHYEFIGDKLIIGKFCAIASGIEFIMNGANHKIDAISTYPFNIMENGWDKINTTYDKQNLNYKGDTIIGNDVWIGQNVTIMPGVHIGDGSIIAANSTVVKNSPAYTIYGGNPAKLIRYRFEKDIISYLIDLKWWDWKKNKIFANLEILSSGDITKLKKIQV